MPLVLEPFGDTAWRIRLPGGANERALLEALRALPRVLDAVVSERHAIVVFEAGARPEALGETVAAALAGGGSRDLAREHVVQARYDGPDLDEMAARAGVSADELIALHTSRRYVVSAIGFLPGFAYLRGLDERLVAPRRPSPRPRVPALSIGIAGPYTGVYPFASSGGWNLVGTAVDFTPFDAEAGATMGLGDRVRFEDVER